MDQWYLRQHCLLNFFVKILYNSIFMPKYGTFVAPKTPKTIIVPPQLFGTSVTIINTLSFRTMYIRKWWKSKYIMILHIVHHYIPCNKINPNKPSCMVRRVWNANKVKNTHFGPIMNLTPATTNVYVQDYRDITLNTNLGKIRT